MKYLINCFDSYGDVEESYSFDELHECLNLMQEKYKDFESMELYKKIDVKVTVHAELV